MLQLWLKKLADKIPSSFSVQLNELLEYPLSTPHEGLPNFLAVIQAQLNIYKGTDFMFTRLK